jgi:hypothetical protein
MAKLLALFALATAAGFSPALADDGPPRHQSEIIVFGGDACPPSTDEEVVVCHRRPEEERYRIPAPLRHSRQPTQQSWTSRVETLDEVSRDSRPNSCSVVGSFGQSGCAAAMIRQWYDDRRARRGGP